MNNKYLYSYSLMKKANKTYVYLEEEISNFNYFNAYWDSLLILSWLETFVSLSLSS